MGNNPSVAINSTVIGQASELAFLHRMQVTFVPSTTTFSDAFKASTATWMFASPDTLEGLVAELTKDTWQGRLTGLGATATEPVWRAMDAHFKQLLPADGQGVRDRIQIPDKVYIARRTSAVVSRQTFTFGTNTAGRVRIRVNRAKYIFADATPAESLADITVISDAVLTVTQLADDAVAQLNAITDFAAVFTASNVAGVVTVVSDVAGYPLIIEIMTTTPGPTMTQAVTTANVANAYRDDLLECQEALETGSHLDPPERRVYHLTDLQGDLVVNLEGLAFVEDQADTASFNPPRPYLFHPWTNFGDKVITLSGDRIGDFDPGATDSLAQQAMAANAGAGYTRGQVISHDRWEFAASALLGATIGYLPGQRSFTDVVLFGSTANAKMSRRDFGDNEYLADDRRFNWYGAEGPNGSMRYGYSPSITVGFADRKWLEDYCTYLATKRLVAWKQGNLITTYTDAAIEAGANVIRLALAELPAVDPKSIVITFKGRNQVDPNDIAIRVYKDYAGFAVSLGVINKIGTLAEPIQLVINDGG